MWCEVWCGVMWCGEVRYGVMGCGVVWCGVVDVVWLEWCGVMWCGGVWWGVVGCGGVWCGVVRPFSKYHTTPHRRSSPHPHQHRRPVAVIRHTREGQHGCLTKRHCRL